MCSQGTAIALKTAVLKLWVATPAGVDWTFTGGWLGPSEICKQSCQRINLYSDAVKFILLQCQLL